MNIEKSYFGQLEGKKVDLYTLTNDTGAELKIVTLGGAIQSLTVPDREGNARDVVCGFDNVEAYMNDTAYVGALVGRVANRIAKGRFSLCQKDYQLYINNGENCLHGGRFGFSHKVWRAEPSVTDDFCALDLYYTSPDGEENFPGTLEVRVTYTLTNDNAVSIRYEATTDKKTIVNMTNHAYFNLKGYNAGTALDHELWIDADTFVPTNASLIPTGEIRAVEGTPMDFRSPKTIGRDFDLSYEPMKLAGGYDHCYNFVEREDVLAAPRATAYSAESGIFMEVYTTEPCVQFYSANFLNNEKYALKGGCPQKTQSAFCLETQKMPDSINHPHFTDCTLDVCERYETVTVYKFSVM
ncbi:MAG: galactose mutarotase [Clostridia bacterium]|nr:galactose mutarotase [Clostridia bacterium]